MNRSTGNDHTAFNFVTLSLLYVGRTGEISQKILLLAMNNVCHDAGLRKQHLGYHNSWDCWYFLLLVWYGVLQCGDFGRAY